MGDNVAKTSAFVALKWLGKNLRRRWPIEQVEAPEPPPITGDASCASPMRRTCNAVEHAAMERDPSWLALLAPFLQAVSCVRLAHVRRSIPVRVYANWVEFFCRKGGQKVHSRQGIYWEHQQ